jgi:hypothetical protein
MGEVNTMALKRYEPTTDWDGAPDMREDANGGYVTAREALALIESQAATLERVRRAIPEGQHVGLDAALAGQEPPSVCPRSKLRGHSLSLTRYGEPCDYCGATTLSSHPTPTPDPRDLARRAAEGK